MLPQTQQQYISKKEEVLSRFRENFVNDFYNHDANFRSILEMLIRDVDPYEIIENMLLDRKAIFENMMKLSKKNK